MHLEHSPVLSLYHPSIPFQGLHWVLQMESRQSDCTSRSMRLHLSSPPMNMSATEVMGWQAVKVLRKKPWVKSMLVHGIWVWESKYVEGLPWYAGMAVSLILTGLKPNGIVGEHLLARYENSVGEHNLQKVSFFWLH